MFEPLGELFVFAAAKGIVFPVEAKFVLGGDAGGTFGQDDDAARERDRLGDVVRDEKGGLALASDDLGNVLRDEKAGLVVERGEGFIQEEHVGVEGEGADERGALPHAARKLRRIALQKFSEPVLFGERSCPLQRFAIEPVLHFEGQADIFFDRAPREELVALEHVADRAPSGHFALGRGQKPRREGQKGAFPAARRSDEGDKLAFLHRKGEVFGRRHLAPHGMIDVFYVVKRQHFFFHGTSFASAALVRRGERSFPH